MCLTAVPLKDFRVYLITKSVTTSVVFSVYLNPMQASTTITENHVPDHQSNNLTVLTTSHITGRTVCLNQNSAL